MREKKGNRGNWQWRSKCVEVGAGRGDGDNTGHGISRLGAVGVDHVRARRRGSESEVAGGRFSAFSSTQKYPRL